MPLSRLLQISGIVLALSAVADLFSIAISQSLLGIAIAIWLTSFFVAPRTNFRLPSPWIPLALYIIWTVLSALLSPPVSRHMPQIWKLWLFAIVPLGYMALVQFRYHDWLRRALVLVATLSAIWGIVQFVQDWFYWRSKNLDFYANYQLARITGFKHHWMTFSGQLMLVLMILVGWLVARHAEKQPLAEYVLGWAAVLIIGVALIMSFTRSAWLGSAAGGAYLLWYRKRTLVLWLPLLALLGYVFAPEYVQQRVRSINPSRADHSAGARMVMYRAGWAMIKAHPVFGIGPEGPQYEFKDYSPDAFIPAAWYGHLHSDYLQTAASRGIPALLFLIVLFLWVWFDQHRLAAQTVHWLPRAVAAACIAYYVEGASEYNFGGSEVLMMWLFLVVFGYSIRTRNTETH